MSRTYRSDHWRVPATYCGNDPQLMDDREPSAHAYDAARAELGSWASDEQITARAFEITLADDLDNLMMAQDDMGDHANMSIKQMRRLVGAICLGVQ